MGSAVIYHLNKKIFFFQKFSTVFILFFFAYSYSFTNNKIDSLLEKLIDVKHDTTRVNILNALSVEFLFFKPDTSLLLSSNALELANKIHWKPGIAQSYHNLGRFEELKGNYAQSLINYSNALTVWNDLGSDEIQIKKSATICNIGLIYWHQSDYSKALDYFFEALKIDETLMNKTGIARNLCNIGLVYRSQTFYPKALEFFLKSLKLAEELNDKNGIPIILSNVAIIYTKLNEPARALEYHFKALELDIKQGNKNGIAKHYTNIGIIYRDINDFPKSVEYFEKSVALAEELGNRVYLAKNLSLLGGIYKIQADMFKTKGDKLLADQGYSKSLEYLLMALKIDMETGDKSHTALVLGIIGSLYTSISKFKSAEEYLQKAISLTNELKSISLELDNQLFISNYYEKIGNYKLAFEHYKKYLIARDSIHNQENEKKIIRTELNFEYDKKEALANAEHQKMQEISNVQIKKQKIIIYSSLAGGILLSLFLTMAVYAYKQKRKSNKSLAEKNILIEKQKVQIEEKHKETTDSITYARRLQHAILPPTELIKKHFPNSFVLYNPKDIVAGDFYWMEIMDNIIFIAAADCTGHGVPGAMVSVVCSNALNRTVKEFGLRDTGKILDKVTDLVLETFEKSSSEVNDGMDISLLAYNLTNKQIQWSGANNPLWYIQNGQVVEIKADKQPVGKFDKRKSFTSHSIEHSDNSVFYLFTDGLPDQFGGPKGKKFMYKRFENNFSDISKLTMEEQQAALEKTFQDWKGSLEQVDDVTVIGIKI